MSLDPFESYLDAAFIRSKPHMLNLATCCADVDLAFAPTVEGGGESA